jgi:hypothetical protein
MFKKSILFIILLVVLLTNFHLYAQETRIFVELSVNDYSEGVESDYAVAMEFINEIDFKGLEKLELPDSGCIDPKVLKKFLPPPIKGTRAYIYIFDEHGHEIEGPTTWQSPVMGCYAYCYAFVSYVREAENQGYWDEIRIYIRDTGISGNTEMRSFHTTDKYEKYVEVDTIKGCHATIFRATDTWLENYGAVQISIAIPSSGLNWSEIVEAAKDGVRQGIQVWSLSPRFTSGLINGSVLIIPPGSLKGPSFSKKIIDEIMTLDVPVQIALAFAEPIWSGWEFWSKTFSGSYPNAFPSFTNFPGPSAPPTPVIPLSVVSASFDREKLTADSLRSQILTRLVEWKENPEAQKAVGEFAQWFDECFTKAVTKARIENLMGQGPVPSYAPPEVPNGPVVNGTLIQSPFIFRGFEF